MKLIRLFLLIFHISAKINSVIQMKKVTIQSPSRFSGIRYKSHRVTELTHRKYNDYKSIFCIKSLKNNKIIVTFRGD